MPLMHEPGAAGPGSPHSGSCSGSWSIVTVLRLVARRGGAWCGPRVGAGRGPQEILAERFARGEIDAAEYRARLDTLRQ